MGLDIKALAGLDKLAVPFNDDAPEAGAGNHRLWPNSDFLEHADGIERGWYVTWNSMRFPAGSYSGYGQWREQLAKSLGHDAKQYWEGTADGPLAKLIHFSDCEGVIGPKTARTLAHDMLGHYATFLDYCDANGLSEHYPRLYRRFMAAFFFASDGGAVVFC